MDANRRQQYYASRDELLRRQVSNSQTLDISILSLSSAGLGFSLLFVKNIVPLKDASCSCLLLLTGIMFIIAIVSTLISFFTSKRAIKTAIVRINECIRTGNELNNQTSLLDRITSALSYVSVIFYSTAVLLTFLFVALNIKLIKS